MNEVEGSNAVAETTAPSHYQGGILVNVKQKITASLANIKHRVNERQGMRRVSEGLRGSLKWKCSCSIPCGYRYFPGVNRLADLQASDCMALLRRVWPEAGVQAFCKENDRLHTENDRYRRAGLLRKAPFMRLGKIPGPLVRGLCHDFPDDFATSAGATVDIQEKALEKALSELFVNRAHRSGGRP